MGFNSKDVYAKDSNWLKAEDLQKQKHRAVITDIKLQEIKQNDRTERKLELHFKDKAKTLLLNKTNADSIAYIHGPDTDMWLNKEIILYPTMVDFQGRSVEAIRVEMPLAEAAPIMHAPGPVSQPPPAPDEPPVDAYDQSFEDDIPF